MILPAAVLSAVLAILAGTAIFSRIGERMEVQGENYALAEDARTVQSLCGTKEPQIQYVGKKIWSVGEGITVPEAFVAAGADGSKAEVTVLDIIDQDGASVLECYRKETGQAVFPDRGVYTFSLRAMDAQRKRGYKKVSLLVDERGEAP